MRRLLIFLLLAGIAVVGTGFYLISRPYAGFQQEMFLDIPRGTSTQAMADLLESKGVVRHSGEFLLARALHPGAKLQAGEYRFAKPASALDVFNRIARGDVFYYELAVPEGQNMFDIAALVESLGIIQGKEFLKTARDPALIRDIDPTAPSLEGYLFPDTYRLTRHTDAHTLCTRMTARFRSAWRQLNSSADVHRTVTMASLVEKEAAVPEERPVVAAVFQNRLQIGMKLDCDPTTVYAALLDGRYRGTIHKSDLESMNRYNTYHHAGLPPGPIANPGMASLQAVLKPAAENYLYFVARGDGSGRHRFSKDLIAHQAAISEYRRAVRQ
jgi:UPF0755 protein